MAMQTHTGGCHCGKVRYEVRLELGEVLECNCSICSKTGSLLAFVPASQFELNSGADALREYQFGKRRIHQTPTMSQMVACRPWLVAELTELRPQGLVVLGATAGRALLGSDFRVGAVRGELLEVPEDYADWLVATVHPSSVLRSRNRDDDFDAFVADLMVAASALG